MKTCSKCRCSKPLSEFYFCSARADKRGNYCKLCASQSAKQFAKDNLPAIRERRRNNPKPHREAVRKYRAANREQINEGAVARYWEDPEKSRKYHSEWNKANRPSRRKAENAKYHANLPFKILKILRARIGTVLKRAGNLKKSTKTVELLGAPWVWVEAHLESLFKPGMTWENHGPVWHIDHIRPCASFDLTDPEQQKMCFHWTNLQPLFAQDNLRKSDKYDPQTA